MPDMHGGGQAGRGDGNTARHRRLPTLAEAVHWLLESRFVRSIYRTRYPDNPRQQVMVVMNSVALHLHPTKVSRQAVRVNYTWGLGGLSLWVFFLLTFTGVFLMFYYVPSVNQAYQSMLKLQTDITLGAFMRNLHRWAAHAMVILVTLHMTRVFLTGSYKPPREFNWMVGIVLWVLTLLLSFTGYLLPWDQLALWAITVGTNIGGYTPFIGKQVNYLLLGGYQIDQHTLIRWYTLHVFFLPIAIIALMGVHFWRIRKDGNLSTTADNLDEPKETSAAVAAR
jgi:quinol-cytochrome oxidoreductase complex cytochrome b subunit